MTVYVDSMRAELGDRVFCHMIADSDAELHALAARLGIHRRRHQTPGPKSHYDITLRERAAAIAAGAVEITWKQASALCARRRETGTLGDPATAIAWYRNWRRQHRPSHRTEADRS